MPAVREEHSSSDRDSRGSNGDASVRVFFISIWQYVEAPLRLTIVYFTTVILKLIISVAIIIGNWAVLEVFTRLEGDTIATIPVAEDIMNGERILSMLAAAVFFVFDSIKGIVIMNRLTESLDRIQHVLEQSELRQLEAEIPSVPK
jgi:Na+/citrate or Na+/malate symporter